jgi:carbamoyltransferase
MTAILGLSAFYHDSAAALVRDGEIVAAAQEERFTRKKHDHGFPQHAIDYCLKEAALEPENLDFVAFYDKPLLKFERLLETYVAYAPVGFNSFRRAMPLWLKEKLWLPRQMDKGLRKAYRGRYVFTEHHESHAASAFYPCPFEEAAIVTMDGVGEWATASYGVGRGNRIELSHELHFPHSLGLLYSAFTYFTGFRVNSGEYKLMGLAPYGEPRYRTLILDKLLDLKEDGSFRMDMFYFNYCQGLTMTGPKFHQLFGGPPRQPEGELTQREMDLAASVQAVTEEIMMRVARHVHRETGQRNLVLAGGVALNCVANGDILRRGPFERLWIQPAAGDAGGALGAALFVWHQLLDNPRRVESGDSQRGSLLGPSFSREEIERYLEEVGAKFHSLPEDEELFDRVSGLMTDEKVVGWFSGRMEFGPRALGCRSIVGDARSRDMQRVMNVKIKFRESFRPFAPVVLSDHNHDYFAFEPGQDSPYMLLVAEVRDDKRLPMDGRDAEFQGLAKLNVPRSTVPAITHVDYSARVQTVDSHRNPRFRRLLERFFEKTGCPVAINTSFNIRGEPIVCTPEDAYRCFMATNMDVLVLESFVLLKEEQPQLSSEDVQKYLESFELD